MEKLITKNAYITLIFFFDHNALILNNILYYIMQYVQLEND